ncbi:MAG: hypothetical protein WCJ01_10660 [Ignavibacteria bacterium]
MAKRIKISITKEKKRVPVPQKPPKVEEPLHEYNRRRIKKETGKLTDDDSGSVESDSNIDS